MCCGIAGADLMVRIPAEEIATVMRCRHVRPMDFTGKPLNDSCTSHRRAFGPRRRYGPGCRAASTLR
jgi:hypothetical protein